MKNLNFFNSQLDGYYLPKEVKKDITIFFRRPTENELHSILHQHSRPDTDTKHQNATHTYKYIGRGCLTHVSNTFWNMTRFHDRRCVHSQGHEY